MVAPGVVSLKCHDFILYMCNNDVPSFSAFLQNGEQMEATGMKASLTKKKSAHLRLISPFTVVLVIGCLSGPLFLFFTF